MKLERGVTKVLDAFAENNANQIAQLAALKNNFTEQKNNQNIRR